MISLPLNLLKYFIGIDWNVGAGTFYKNILDVPKNVAIWHLSDALYCPSITSIDPNDILFVGLARRWLCETHLLRITWNEPWKYPRPVYVPPLFLKDWQQLSHWFHWSYVC